MAHRFYLPELATCGDSLTLEGEQAHHAANVMRFQPGDSLSVFDGRGLEAFGQVTVVSKKQLSIEVVQRDYRDRDTRIEVRIAVALPKGDRQKFLVEKLVELGCRQMIPLLTQRGVAAPNPKALGRIEKQVVEASKQCERRWLMDIRPPMDLTQLAKWSAESLSADTPRLIGDPYEGRLIGDWLQSAAPGYLAVIGPEGGFDEQENQLSRELGFQPMRIGTSILRVETAAIAAMAILAHGSLPAEAD